MHERHEPAVAPNSVALATGRIGLSALRWVGRTSGHFVLQ